MSPLKEKVAAFAKFLKMGHTIGFLNGKDISYMARNVRYINGEGKSSFKLCVFILDCRSVRLSQ